ncbi:hypothetical protein ABPG74_000965 [Tetrahymena malaccensis]
MKNFSEQKLAENDVNISFSADVKATTFQVDENYSKQIDNELDGSKNILFQLNASQNCIEQPSNRSLALKKQVIFKSSSARIDDYGGEKLESESIALYKQNNSIVSFKEGTSTSIKNKNIPSRENIQSQQIRLSNLANTINEFKKKKRIFQSKSILDKQSQQEQENEKHDQSQNQLEKPKPMKFLFFKQTNMIKRFITNLQSKARSFIFKRLSQHQFNLIGDKSSDYFSYQEMNLIIKKEQKQMKKFELLKIFLRIYLDKSEKLVISPDSMFCLIWDIINVLLWISIIFYVPFRVNFGHQIKHETAFQSYIILFLIIETLIKFNRASFKRGRIITSREFIIKKYFKNEFIFDFFILVCYIISIQNIQLIYFEYVLELRLIRVLKTYKELFQKLDQEAKHTIFYRISQLFLIILCFINLQGSIFVLFGIKEDIDPIKYQQDLNVNFQRYVAGLYWSTITMTTIGYGDIIPNSTTERIYVSFVSLISCGIFGYSISQIGGIVMEMQNKSDLFNKKMKALNKLMVQRQMSKNIMQQVIRYYEYLHKSEENNFEDQGLQMIEKLPKSMRENIVQEMYSKLINSHKVFSLNFSKAFLDKLSIKIKSMKLGPETNLYRQDELDQKIYFISRGSMMLYFQQNQVERQCKILTKGDMIGEIEFFGQTSRKFGVKSQTEVQLLFIEFEDFYQTLQLYEKDFESYNQIKDKFNLEGNLKSLSRECESCGKFNHLFFDCFSLKYFPNLIHIKHTLNVSQQRFKGFNRTNKKTIKALLNINKSGLQFIDQITHTDNCIDEKVVSSYNSLTQVNTQNNENDQIASPSIKNHTINDSCENLREKQKSVSRSNSVVYRSKQNVKMSINKGTIDQYITQKLESKHIESNRLINIDIDKCKTNSESHVSPEQIIKSLYPSTQKIKYQQQTLNDIGSPTQFGLEKDQKQSQGTNSYIASNYFWDIEFEKSKIYMIYFPHNNQEQVLQEYKKYQLKIQSKNKKKKYKSKTPSRKKTPQAKITKQNNRQTSFENLLV